MCEYTAKDYKKGQPRWCPGCGDHFFLASLHKAMAEIGKAPWENAVISGIGCSSRLPYYMNTYAMQTIHGRAAAISTGAKVANPNLTVWQISGDGDGLAIGGNHFIHAVRRNIDLNMILLNNRIYGLTKGQYSPTSPRGFVSKSSPYGTVEDPFHPAELCFGARGRFFARAVATDAPGTVEILKAAMAHKGASVCEILQNCVIFNNGTHDSVAKKEDRAKNAIYLKHGEPMLFGENNEYGLMQEGFGLKVVKLGENGITEKDILIHDAHCMDNTLQLKLALMEGPDFLTVWQISGDGDGLAIGGNHFIHAVRRNIDLNMILLNNRIYGLTKGQYSPTSPRGFVSKSSPYGTVEDPFHPAELCFGARGRFFARAVATDAPGTVEILKAAMAHKGASVCEILQNCVIFNNGTHDSVAKKEDRAKNAIYLKHGEPMLFGENNEYGLMQEGFGLKVVKLGENGITEKDILIHDAHCMDNTLQLKLALMEGPDFPIALGVIRDVEAPTYDDAVHEQIEEVSAKKKYHNFEELLMTNDTWEVK